MTAGALSLFLSLSGTADAAGQSVFVGGGLNMPTGDLDVLAASGYSALGGLTWGVGDAGLFLAGEGFYATHDNHGDAGDKTKIYAAFGQIGYGFAPQGEAGFYVLAGAGWVANQQSPGDGGDDVNENLFGLMGSAGYGFPIGGINGWIEGRVVDTDSDDVSFAGIVAGIGIPFGGN